MKKNWYEDEKSLEEAISFVLQYSCIFGWVAFACNKTPCADYKALDEEIPDGLRCAIGKYLDNLPKGKYRDLIRDISLLLGERFFVQKKAVIKILSRILFHCNPGEDVRMIEYALQMQIKHRLNLLETFRASYAASTECFLVLR